MANKSNGMPSDSLGLKNTFLWQVEDSDKAEEYYSDEPKSVSPKERNVPDKYKVGIDISTELWTILKYYSIQTGVNNSKLIEYACRKYLNMEMIFTDIPEVYPDSAPQYGSGNYKSGDYKHLSYYLTPELDKEIEAVMESEFMTKSAIVTKALLNFWNIKRRKVK